MDEGSLLGAEQPPRAVAQHHANANRFPVIDQELRRAGARPFAGMDGELHARAVGKSAVALAVALRQPHVVQQGIGAVRVVVHKRLVELGIVERRSRSRIDLGRFGLPEIFGLDDRFPIDGEAQRLAEAQVVKHRVLVARHRVPGLDPAVHIREDRVVAGKRRISVVDIVAVALAARHQQSVVLRSDVAALEGDLARRRREGDHLVALDVDLHLVDVG